MVARGQAIFSKGCDVDGLIQRGALLPPAPVCSIRPSWGSGMKVDLKVRTKAWNAGPHGHPIFRPGAKVELIQEGHDIPPWTNEWLRTAPPKNLLKGTVLSNEKDRDLPTCKEDHTLVTILVPGPAWKASKPPENVNLVAVTDVTISPYLRFEAAIERLALRSGVPFTPLVRSSYPRLGRAEDDSVDLSRQDVRKSRSKTKAKAKAEAKEKAKAKEKARVGPPLSNLERAALNLTEFVLPHSPNPAEESREEVISQLPTAPLNSRLNTGQLAVIRDCLRMDEASVQLGDVKPDSPARKAFEGTSAEEYNWAKEHLQSIKAESHVLPFRLIHGPPGTGKTHTLVELVLQMALSARPPPSGFKSRTGSRRRVLVTGPSNTSVDAIASRLLDKGAPWTKRVQEEGVSFLRLGLDGRIGASVESASLDALLSNRHARREEEANVAATEGLLKMLKERVTSTNSHVGRNFKADEDSMFYERALHHVREMHNEAKRALRKAENRAPLKMIRGSEVVIATLTSLHALINARSRFDVLIVDEASQAFEPVVLLALRCLSSGGTLIMLGDPNQLPPSLSSHAREAARELPIVSDTLRRRPDECMVEVMPHLPMRESTTAHSLPPEVKEVGRYASVDVGECMNLMHKAPSLPLTLFERLMTQYPSSISMLSTQYRMNNDIMAFPAKSVYQGRLTAHESVADHALSDLEGYFPGQSAASIGGPLLLPGNDVRGTDPLTASVHFMDTAFCQLHEKSAQQSYVNDFEAQWVVQHVEGLVSNGLSPEQVAILTPYRGQVMLLRSMVQKKYAGRMTVGSIDAMQGLEAEAVVLSLVRSNERRATGFTSDPRRLNVAITRARRHLAVVGDGHTLSRSHGRENSLLQRYVAWLRTNAVVYSPHPPTAQDRISRAMLLPGQRRPPRPEAMISP